MKATHPERCPSCGKLTWNWLHLSNRIWIECDHCGHKDAVSNMPVHGSNTDSQSRKATRPA